MGANVIRVGIIGGGAVVRMHHWPVLQQMSKEIRVVALARRDRREAQSFAQEAGIPSIYDDYRQLLKDKGVDAVLTAVPIELNGPVLLDAIRAGKHVLAEKPIAATPGQARAIVTESTRRQQVVLIGENFRYRRDLLMARDLIRGGTIGTVFAFQLTVKFDLGAKARQRWISRGWRKQARHPGGFVLDAGVHPVAALRDVLGEVSELSAHVLDTSSLINGPDSALMQVRMTSGAVGHCFFSYTVKEQREVPLDFSIFGTYGVLRVVPGTITLTRRVGGSQRVLKVPEADGGYSREWEDFCRAIQGKKSVLSTPAQAYQDLLVIDAALRSSASGGRVRILGSKSKRAR
jgi:predicted dehydrogenase